MRMKFRLACIAIVLLIMLPGCTTPRAMESIDATTEEMDLPTRLNLISDTAGRDIDRGLQMDIMADANGSNTLLLWVSTGFSG